MLYRCVKASGGNGGDLTAFSDGNSVAGWAREAVSWAVGEGLLKGGADGRQGLLVGRLAFGERPLQQRVQAAVQQQEGPKGAGRRQQKPCRREGLLKGGADGRLDPGDGVTRAETAQILMRFLEE